MEFSKEVERLVRKHWQSNWGEEKIMDTVIWIMKFANDIAASWLEIYLEKLKKEKP